MAVLGINTDRNVLVLVKGGVKAGIGYCVGVDNLVLDTTHCLPSLQAYDINTHKLHQGCANRLNFSILEIGATCPRQTSAQNAGAGRWQSIRTFAHMGSAVGSRHDSNTYILWVHCSEYVHRMYVCVWFMHSTFGMICTSIVRMILRYKFVTLTVSTVSPQHTIVSSPSAMMHSRR